MRRCRAVDEEGATKKNATNMERDERCDLERATKRRCCVSLLFLFSFFFFFFFWRSSSVCFFFFRAREKGQREGKRRELANRATMSGSFWSLMLCLVFFSYPPAFSLSEGLTGFFVPSFPRFYWVLRRCYRNRESVRWFGCIAVVYWSSFGLCVAGHARPITPQPIGTSVEKKRIRFQR